MPLKIIRNDITKVECDAIVNAANSTLLGGGGVDGAIHRAAGPALLEECRTLGGCATGEAKITKGYDLPCKYVIHTVGPVWMGGKSGEEKALASCYEKSLELAEKNGCGSVAFPLISAGVYGYPKDEAFRIASDTIEKYLVHSDSDMLVYIVLFESGSITVAKNRYREIEEYIDERYVSLHTDARERRRRKKFLENSIGMFGAPEALTESAELDVNDAVSASSLSSFSGGGLDKALENIDESFSEMLLRMIDKKGMTDVQCYKKANVDRKLFSKIRSNKNYKPAKATVIAFAIALELTLDETKDMLMKAGFALSRSNKSDIIIEYFISNGIYDVFEINEALFAFDQTLLGA